MKKITNGVLCNTETARLLGEMEYMSNPSDKSWYCERLYKTKTGKYFLYGYGNWGSPYAKPTGNGGYKDGENIVLFPTPSAAREWAEKKINPDAYIAVFGEPEEDGEVDIKVTITTQARAKLDAERDRTGETLSAIVDRVIMGL